MNKVKFDPNAVIDRFITHTSELTNTNISLHDSININKRPIIKKNGCQQRQYYITDEQHKKLKLLAVNNNTDTSSLVRKALEEFLQKYNF